MPKDTPSIFSVSPYSSSVAREMYPGQVGTDDRQDAARHMLAAGTMARKYGPTVADLAGKAHEYSTLRALMMLMSRGEMPPDFRQDMHNNALGIEMAGRAKSQQELEDLVQQAAERAATTRTEGRPWISKAKGGEVDADELNRPFIGYRSAGRRPESQQDRRAAADAPLSALRGAVSGVLGAPGDIESFIRMLPGLSEKTVLPTSEDVERRLPMRDLNQTPTGRAFTTAGQLGGGFYTGPGSPLRAVAALPSAVSRAGRDFAMASGVPAVNVVKPKGGNWLAGSVERAVNPMQQTVLNETGLQNLAERAGVDVSESVRARQLPEAAMNRWLETKLGKYVRNEMATPEDPLRALAERGITHAEVAPLNTYFGDTIAPRREAAGFPAEGIGQSEAAQRWEAASDMAIYPDVTAGYLAKTKELASNPWLEKVPPETKVYDIGPRQSNFEALGFNHLVDELRNAVNPESGLPANLRLKYQDLEKVTVPQAVERVAKINDWRAAQKAEADMARAMNPATQVVKEYPEQGFKWVELRKPESTGKKATVERSELDELGMGVDDATLREVAEDMAWNEGLEEGTRAFDNFVNDTIRAHNTKTKVDVDESIKILEDALKYEGETMGHCVGGYCPDVVEGRSKIYSLRDKKGQPHVTIEVSPRRPTVEQATKIAIDEGLPPKGMETLERVAQIMSDPAFSTQDIVQIKGKGNKAPKEDYLPAVQDFVRSGNFGKVGDLQNTGLIDIQDPNAVLRALGKVSPERNIQQAIDNFNTAVDSAPNAQRYMSLDEMRDFLGGPPPAEGFSRGGQVRGYAAGGQVSGANFPTGDYDEARIDNIVGELHAMNAG
jgi:uncharacterized protein YidB (DUF937 family)